PPGARASVRVQFTPDAAIDYSGQVQLYISNAQALVLSVSLRGRGDAGCFTVNPASLDFGAVYAGCAIPQLAATVHNGCSAPVNVTSLSASAPFALPSAAPFTLQPGQNVSIAVDYRPPGSGDDVGALQISASTAAAPYTVGLTGLASAGRVITD